MSEKQLIDINDVEALAEAHREAKRKERRAKRLESLQGGAASSSVEAIIDADIAKVRKWIMAAGVKYLPRDNSFMYRGNPRPPGFMSRVIKRALSDPDLQGSEAELATHLFADEQRQAYVQALRDAIPLHGAASKAPERFLEFFLQRPPTALDAAVFRQWLWQIKRRIHGEQTEWEMMPLFTGGQGWGKTRHLGKLWESVPPLSTFVAKGQRFKIFDDDFGRAIFSQSFIIPFEEMSGAKNLDMENLKMFITETEVTARIMRAEQFRTMKMNASFYGTSNAPGGASLYDESGMRRFWVFQCPPTKYNDDVHGPQLKALGPLSDVWLAIDATSEASPIRPFLDKLGAEQDRQFSAHGALHDFFSECVELETSGAVVPRSMIWDTFITWKAKQAGYDREKLKMRDMDAYVAKTFGPDVVRSRTGGVAYALCLKNGD